MRNLYLLAAFFVAPLLGLAQAQYTLTTGSQLLTTVTTSNECSQLTNSDYYQRGSLWNNTMVNLNQNFDVYARLYFGTNEAGGDGIAFVLQREGTSYIGNWGAGIGYHRFGGQNSCMPTDNPGPVQSFIIEFDTYQNDASAPIFCQDIGDPAADHVGFMSYSNAYHTSSTALKAPESLSGNIEDGQWHDAHFAWNATTHTMTVTFATTAGTTQTFSYTGDIASTLFSGNTNVYWGFTASNGSFSPNEHKVCIVPPPPPPADCGQLRTQTPGGWGAPPHGNNPGAYLYAHFSTSFPNGLMVGLSPNYNLKLTSAEAITNYIPAGGKPAKLTANYTNPDPKDLKNTLVDHLVALTLSVKFDADDPNFGAAGVKLGDMLIGSGPFANWTVSNFLAEANKVLGGGTSNYTVQQVVETASAINENYVDGTTDKGYLKCPTSTPSGRMERPVTVIDMPVNQLRVQPNPSAGQFEVVLGQLQGGTAQLLITNTNGAIVERRTITGATQGTSLRVDLSKYAAGLYMVKLITPNGEQNQKLLLQK